jgi:ribonuclease HI
MENGRMNDYTSADLMAAILSLQDATAAGFERADARMDAKVEQLRHDMNRRFDRVDERFGDVYARFDDVYARFDDVYARFDRIDRHFDRVNQRFDSLEGRVAKLEPHDHRPPS